MIFSNEWRRNDGYDLGTEGVPDYDYEGCICLFRLVYFSWRAYFFMALAFPTDG